MKVKPILFRWFRLDIVVFLEQMSRSNQMIPLKKRRKKLQLSEEKQKENIKKQNERNEMTDTLKLQLRRWNIFFHFEILRTNSVTLVQRTCGIFLWVIDAWRIFTSWPDGSSSEQSRFESSSYMWTCPPSITQNSTQEWLLLEAMTKILEVLQIMILRHTNWNHLTKIVLSTTCLLVYSYYFCIGP